MNYPSVPKAFGTRHKRCHSGSSGIFLKDNPLPPFSKGEVKAFSPWQIAEVTRQAGMTE
jgi:hypothetical protein